MLEHITPLILTYNEAPNIGRLLAKLDWAGDIVVVDSFSTDTTLSILENKPQVRVFKRHFTSFADQCNFGLTQTGIKSNWVLSLDADYIPTDGLIHELEGLQPQEETAGYSVRFRYCVFGKPLRGSLYPPVTVLFRKGKAGYTQDGHAHRIQVQGGIQMLKSEMLHDDRKDSRRWVSSQRRYAHEEAEKLMAHRWQQLNWKDKIRKLILPAPFCAIFYTLFMKKLILDGGPGIYYCFQRGIAEALLSGQVLKKMIETWLGKRASVLTERIP